MYKEIPLANIAPAITWLSSLTYKLYNYFAVTLVKGAVGSTWAVLPSLVYAL